MQRDIRAALPNSIRVSATGNALEMINTVAGARYRRIAPGAPARLLDFTAPDTEFDLLGDFPQITTPFNSNAHYLSVYNIGGVDAFNNPLAGANAYAPPDASGANVITPAGTGISIADNGDEDHVTLDAAFRFSFTSPQQRIYLVDTPISYVCDTVSGTLRRYRNYALQAAQPVPPGVSGALIADNVQACSFSYTRGTSTRAGLMTLDLTIQAAGSNDVIRLLHQVHVVNAP
jgi:MSHA biogenesis protein MshO